MAITRPPGRPTKTERGHTILTPEIRDAVVAMIRNGNYIETACRAAGISQDCYYRWTKLGEAGEWPYCELTQALKTADAEGEAHLVGVIRKAADSGPQYWPAAARILESKHERWARQDRTKGQRINVNLIYGKVETTAAETGEVIASRPLTEIAEKAGGD